MIRRRKQRYHQTGKFHKARKISIIIVCILAFFALVFIFIKVRYTVTNVKVEGNTHYSSDEIINKVLTGKLGNNSIYLSLKYKDKPITDIPFIEMLNVSIEAPNSIRIRVYEKKLAGYVEYLGTNLYFDNDGIVVESSDVITQGVPNITGLPFSHMALYEKLPVENEKIFSQILELTQTLEKYNLDAKQIYFDSMYHVTLFFDAIRVNIGEVNDLDAKFGCIYEMLPDLVGKSGIVSMESFTANSKYISFREDKTTK